MLSEETGEGGRVVTFIQNAVSCKVIHVGTDHDSHGLMMR